VTIEMDGVDDDDVVVAVVVSGFAGSKGGWDGGRVND
jgi:hypothetical protein